MSILIKGMEMPKEGCKGCCFVDRRRLGDICPFLRTEVSGNVERGGKPYACPLVEVPTPHGRLKDVDVIIKDECHSCDGSCEVIECDCLNCTKAGCDTIRALNDAPTIIEAEE